MPSAITRFVRNGEKVPEGSEHAYAATFVDRNGQALQFGAITAITAWLLDVTTGTAINERIAQNVLNANGGSLTDNGNGTAAFALGLDAADALIVDTSKEEEKHALVLRVAYTRQGGGAGELRHQIEYTVVNLRNP